MTFQNKDMGGFRELDLDEVEAVSGGTDTVEDRYNILPIDAYGHIFDDYNDGSGVVDEDGIIVVTAELTSSEIQAINYAITANLYVLSIAGAAAGPGIAAEIGALTTFQQSLLAAGTAASAPLAPEALEILKDLLFERAQFEGQLTERNSGFNGIAIVPH